MNIDSSVKNIYGVGPKILKRLKALKIETFKDLIFYYPFRFEDFSKVVKISEIKPNEPVTIKAKIQLLNSKRSSFRRKIIVEALVEDETGSIQVIWFNQPFIKKTLKPGDVVFFSGIPAINYNYLQFVSPTYEKASANNIHTGRIIPIYPTTDGITQKQLRYLISSVINHIDEVQDYLPEKLLERFDLISQKNAIKSIHFPKNQEEIDLATKRLKFDELFIIQFFSQSVKNALLKNNSKSVLFLEKETKEFVNSLGFDLTEAQRKCSWQILKNLGQENPMNRLLEGDVGSGKTAVAAIACLNVCLNGFQAILMAPTEILASQHLRSFVKYFKNYDFNIAILTRTEKKIFYKGEEIECPKKDFLDKIKSGEVKLIIGTHALISEKVFFQNLALTIVDEQHRFGVRQRQVLKEKNIADFFPHFLSMTATPIPRSLALTVYGDLDLSIIDQMPKGRKKIISRMVQDNNRDKAYNFIREKIKEGRQVFVICPLIDESDKLGVKAVTTEFKKLSKQIFPEFKTEMLHGKMKSEEKEKIMKKFKDNKTHILVSTSVIEVGIDIANASIMLIEGADRFGLAQLHQFRGRVGRGEYQSYCLVFTDKNNPEIIARLTDFVNCDNGFELAEKDLQRRGPGEVFGARQSGLPELKMASLTDYKLIELAKNAAEVFFEEFANEENIKKIREKSSFSEIISHME